jgi:hypothetical protein
MAAIHYRTVWIVNIGLLLVAISVAQQSPTTPAPPETPGRQTPLYAISTAEVPDVSSLLISFPLVCTSDNTVFTRMGTPTGLDDLISISSNGRKVVQFRTDRINDINSPTPVTFFAEGEVYQVVTGRGPENKNVEIHSPNGEVSRQLASIRKYWVTRFQNDGTYAGAIPLDLPFQPLQIGVFKSGDFLIAGVMPGTDEPKLALVKSNGQLNRYLNLEDDVHLREERSDSTGPQKKEDPRGLPKEGTNTLLHALMRSSIIADGNNLLLFRKGQQTPVYSVSAGGEVKEISMKIPEGFAGAHPDFQFVGCPIYS